VDLQGNKDIFADHQLCLVHLQRNVRNQMNKEDSQAFF